MASTRTGDHRARVPDTSDRPLLTVDVTAYNAEDTVKRAVDSALAQTWDPLEILIVDDGSTDGTRDILARLEAEQPRIRVILHDTNQGIAVERNTLIEHARGDGIAFFDDDDTSHPERVTRQWHQLTTYEHHHGPDLPILCFAGLRRIYPNGLSSTDRPIGSAAGGPVTHGPRLLARLLWARRLPKRDRGMAGAGIQMGRRSTYTRLGGFDPRFRRLEDTELNVRVARAGGHLIGVSAPLVTQDMAPAPDRNVAVQQRANLLLIQTHRDAFPSDAVYGATKRWIQARYALRRGDTATAGKLLLRAALIHPVHTLHRAAAYLLETSQMHTTRKGLDAAFRAAE